MPAFQPSVGGERDAAPSVVVEARQTDGLRVTAEGPAPHRSDYRTSLPKFLWEMIEKKIGEGGLVSGFSQVLLTPE